MNNDFTIYYFYLQFLILFSRNLISILNKHFEKIGKSILKRKKK